MLRETILQERDRRGWSSYRLGQESGVPIRTVQRYLSGGCDLAGERIEKLLISLDLVIKPKKTTRK